MELIFLTPRIIHFQVTNHKENYAGHAFLTAPPPSPPSLLLLSSPGLSLSCRELGAGTAVRLAAGIHWPLCPPASRVLQFSRRQGVWVGAPKPIPQPHGAHPLRMKERIPEGGRFFSAVQCPGSGPLWSCPGAHALSDCKALV